MGLRHLLVPWVLAFVLSACASTPRARWGTAERLGPSPCAKVHRDAHDACVAVAERCASSVRRCLGALPELADPIPYGPSAEPCDVAILRTLASTAPEHVPELLASVASNDPRSWRLLSVALPRTSEALELALDATPGETATVALGLIAAGKDRQGAVARFRARADARRAALHALDTLDDVFRQSEWRTLAGLVQQEERLIPAAQLVADARALRIGDDAWTVCNALGFDVNGGRPWLAREAFARIAALTKSGPARDCALRGTTGADAEVYAPGVARRWESYGHLARRRPFGGRGCAGAAGSSPAQPWSFQRLGKDRSRAAVRHDGWRAAANASPLGQRPDRRAFVCFERPTPEGASMGAGRLEMQGGSAVFIEDGGTWHVAHEAIALHVLDARYAFVVETSVVGDDILAEHQIVSLWDADARHLEELVGLPGESYHWSFVDDDGALVVATSERSRFVSAIHRGGQTEDVACW